MISTKDGVSYAEEPVHCDGAQPAIVASRSCSIPLTVFRQDPFNLDYPDQVIAKVRSRNDIGWNDYSDSNLLGAIIQTEPVAMQAPTRGPSTD